MSSALKKPPPVNQPYLATWDFSVSQYPSILSYDSLQTLRFLLALSCFLITSWSVSLYPLSSQIYFFTNIGNNLVALSALLAFMLGNGKPQRNPRLHKYASILTEYSLPVEILITAVYWPVLHKGMVAHAESMNSESMYWLFCISHSWPLIASFLHVLFTKCIFLPHVNWKYLARVGPIYLSINAFGTWERGRNLYVFLPWQESIPIAIGVGIALFVVGMGQYYATSWVINRTIKACNVKKSDGSDVDSNGPKGE